MQPASEMSVHCTCKSTSSQGCMWPAGRLLAPPGSVERETKRRGGNETHKLDEQDLESGPLETCCQDTSAVVAGIQGKASRSRRLTEPNQHRRLTNDKSISSRDSASSTTQVMKRDDDFRACNHASWHLQSGDQKSRASQARESIRYRHQTHQACNCKRDSKLSFHQQDAKK